MRIDAHFHVPARSKRGWKKAWRKAVEAADALEIDHLCTSILPGDACAAPDVFRKTNTDMIAAMKAYPGRLLGYAFVNPGYAKEAVEEIDRCVAGAGMTGIKLYHAYTIDDPASRPVIEKCIDLGVPILMHAGHAHMDIGQPTISTARHFARAAREYPEAMFIEGHIGGGGDWEWSIKGLKGCPSVFLDTSGSVVDEGMVEMAERELGADRLLFATDCSMCAGVGKILGAGISERKREKIFSGNYRRILARRRV